MYYIVYSATELTVKVFEKFIVIFLLYERVITIGFALCSDVPCTKKNALHFLGSQRIRTHFRAAPVSFWNFFQMELVLSVTCVSMNVFLLMPYYISHG